MSLAQLNHGWCSVSYFLHSKNIQCLPFDHRQSCPSSMNLTFLKHPRRPSLYISNTWSYCSRSDRNFPEAHRLSTNKQATRREKKNTEKKNRERQREKGENSSAVHLADDILCTLSVISFSSARMDRISPLSLSGMTASLKSLETPFSSVSLSLLFLSLSLPLSGCYFPETLWISYNSFFLSSPPLLLSHLSLDVNSTPASRQTVRLSVHLSVYSEPPPPPFFSPIPVLPKNPRGKIKDEIKKKKKKFI